MIVVAIIGLLAAIAIPNFVRARHHSQNNACINNLRQIDGAMQQWALEIKQAPTVTPALSDVAPYLKSSVTCPAGGTSATFATSYAMGAVGDAIPVTCLIGGGYTTPFTHALPADTTQ